MIDTDTDLDLMTLKNFCQNHLANLHLQTHPLRSEHGLANFHHICGQQYKIIVEIIVYIIYLLEN